MFQLSKSVGSRLGYFLAGAAVASIVGGVAYAITSPNFIYNAPQTGYLHLGPSDFGPEDFLAANNFSIGDISAGSAATDCLIAGVHLPQNALVKSVRVTYFSNNQSDLSLRLQRLTPANLNVVNIANETIDDNSGNIATENLAVVSSPAHRTINNAAHAYRVSACLAAGTILVSVRIGYTYTSAGG